MARIAGIDLPKNKRIDVGLAYIYGIGRPIAKRILAETTIKPETRVKDLTEQDVNLLNTIITREYRVEGDLKRDVSDSIRRLIEVGAYRGMRHRRNLPCRGQRTKTNARTKRGKRKTIGAVKAERKLGLQPTQEKK